MIENRAHIQRVFSDVLGDLDFHQSIISRTKGRLSKYPVRTLRYIATNEFLKLATKLSGTPLITAKTFWGDIMRVVFPAYRSVYHFGILDSWELIVQKTMIEKLAEGDTFIDVGANMGFYTLLGSALVGSTGHVHSFEPTPSTFELLQSNTANKTNIALNKVALGAEAGTATLADYGLLQNGLNSIQATELDGLQSQKIEVPVATLDDYCAQKSVQPKLVKMDVEGYELQVLHGATKMLAEAKPILLLEVSSYEESASLFAFLTEHGYRGYYPDEQLNLVPYEKHAHKRMNMVFTSTN